jgi:hypothetical protein
MPETPERYQPEKRRVDDKDWLREQYWGDEKQSLAEVAAETGLSEAQVGRYFDAFGIPRRPGDFARTNGVSPFAGFYGPGEPVPDDDPEATKYDPSYERDPEPHWTGVAQLSGGEARGD